MLLTYFISRSSYANGHWYRVRVVRTSVNATLNVNPVGSREAPDSRFVDTGVTVMESAHVITFGALNPNRLELNNITCPPYNIMFMTKAAILRVAWSSQPAGLLLVLRPRRLKGLGSSEEALGKRTKSCLLIEGIVR